ncbi:hypothetical protein [Chitinophaga filiformis]|uniref:Solute:sodium symporter small subunit n=1 Tax=Chitinophaga filiformis TaxID=104663 RepID=A0ABY4I3Q1_CHIFI|nr:hypothetical protein [Chitinophaga filiformis]UPK70452.1 hypothetical protein MYF79_03980 [Chitinophaga filiformis]
MENQEPQQDRKEPFDMRIVHYFVRIMRTVFLGFFWMLVNVFLGLYLGFAVPEESTRGRMIFFYIFLVLSLAGYLFIVRKMWRNNGHVQDNYE